MFQAQLRALLRAAVHGPLRIMFPFVSGLEQLRAARRAVLAAAESVRARGDVPGRRRNRHHDRGAVGRRHRRSARWRGGFLQHRHQRFDPVLSGGRSHRRSRLDVVQPLHPAILRTLRLVARAGRRGRIPVAVCGEMASDPMLLALLVGLGLREFSMAPIALPLAKQVLREPAGRGRPDRRAPRAARAHGRRCRARAARSLTPEEQPGR